MFKTITVTLYDRRETGRDAFGASVCEEVPVEVPGVLAAPSSTQDIVDTVNLTGRKAAYTLGIPKGDANDWENRRVDFFGKSWRTIGIPQEGIEENIPLAWNRKVMVERYE